jgi:DUF1365 family protein
VNSCLYEGTVRHRRHGELEDRFSQRMFMVYLDLDELPRLFDGRALWSARGPAIAWFRRSDHLGDPRTPLPDAVRALVLERTGAPVDGPIRLLTHLRYFGHCFNPVSFYYCFDRAGEHVTAVVAHVTNTPWGESHSYVLAAPPANGHASPMSGRFAKELHVSPLMGMDNVYDWRLSEPGERLSVHIESLAPDGRRVFDATLALERSEMTAATMRRALVRYPMLTMQIVARIYGHALRLRLRGASYFPHPDRPAAST